MELGGWHGRMMDSGPECGAGTGLGVRGGDTGGRLGQAQIPPVPPLGTWGRGAALPFPAAGQFHALRTATLSADVTALPLRMCLSLSKAGCSSNTPRSSPAGPPAWTGPFARTPLPTSPLASSFGSEYPQGDLPGHPRLSLSEHTQRHYPSEHISLPASALH